MTLQSPTRERILEATAQLLSTRPPSDVRMADVAAAAGLSRQILYLHFRNRTDLLVEAARFIDAWAGLDEALAPVLAAKSGREALARLATFMAVFTPRVYRVAAAAEALRSSDEAAAAAWNDRAANRRRGLAGLVRRLKAEGDLADGWSIKTATDLLWAMTSHAVWGYLVEDRGWSPARYRRHLRRVLEAALLRDEARTSR